MSLRKETISPTKRITQASLVQGPEEYKLLTFNFYPSNFFPSYGLSKRLTQNLNKEIYSSSIRFSSRFALI